MLEKKNNDGAVVTISRMDPDAPTETKNACMTSVAMDSPDPAIAASFFGIAVANATVTRVMMGISMPVHPNARVADFAAKPTAHANVSAYDAFLTLNGANPSPSTATPPSASLVLSLPIAANVALVGITPFASANSPAKYNAFIKLSAHNAALIIVGCISSAFATATKFTAPPMCRAINALAIFHPSSPRARIGTAKYATSVPNVVPSAPTTNAGNNAALPLITRFTSAV
mmetsp:Transcript_2688/g.5871  ORF Transcript_2688/g.5871 Transcript_2688/m.5871 type:complete len:230 (+) Transcript_2688:182-871(+)